MIPAMRHLIRLGQTISDWPVASQQHSLRNAMVALTDCSRRRVEREEVALYLADKAARRDGSATAASAEHEVAAHA